MKYKDIIYGLNNRAFTPYNMGTVSTEICDCFVPIKCYAHATQDIKIATSLCENFGLDEEVINVISEEAAPEGFYKKYVHYFILHVLEDTDIAYYPRIAFGQSRHWIDGKLAFIGHCEDGKYATIYTMTLQQGYHVFCIEHIFDSIPIVRIDVADRGSNDTNAVIKNNFWYKPNEFIVNYTSVSLFDGESFDFNIIPVDLINLSYDAEACLYIRSDVSDKIIYKQDISLKENYSIELSQIAIKDENKYNQLIVTFQVQNRREALVKKELRLFRCPPDQYYVNKLKQRASFLLREPEVPQLLKNELHYLIDNFTDSYNDVLYGKYLKDIIENKNWEERLYGSNGHYIYYFSKEDGRYYYYYIVLPKNYDPSQKYPLLLTIRHGHVENIYDSESSSNYSNNFSEIEGIICADIGGRGATLASYMGEAFMMEEIQHILQNFSVDRKRVYGVAHCAGNFALFNFTQSHPDLFAGIYARKANLYFPNIQNLYNVPCLYLLSSFAKDDPIGNLPASAKKKIRKFQYIHVLDVFDEDVDLTRVQYSKAAMELLMANELDEYPKDIYYRTEKNRIRKAYFIEIESIEDNKNYASIHCHWSSNQITIRTKHCTGIEISIPPQIDRQKLEVVINGKVFLLHGYKKAKIACRHSKNKGFYITDALCTDICQYKGTGLLDVYYSPLVVINCEKNSAILKQVAETFSKPTSNAAYEVIYVSYPIKAAIEHADLENSAFIIVDNNCTNPNSLLKSVRECLKIQMDKHGYRYKDTFIEGEYCIMQIVENPWNHKHSILYINTNKDDLYNRNFFTRKMSIPSYASGLNPYLNGVALLFTGTKYYTVESWGRDFKELK